MKPGNPRLHRIAPRAVAVWRSLASWGRERLPAGWAPLKVHLIILVVGAEGEKVFGAFARAPLSGWTAAVAAPSSAIEGSVWRSVVTTAFAGSAVLALGIFLALFVGRRIANEMAAATAAAEALAEGRTETIPDSPVAELTRLAAAVRKSALKGIALSGYGQQEDLNRSRAAGFSAHLIKPVDAETLVETIAAVV